MIIPYEAALWNVSSWKLTCRVSGESGGSWNAWNGPYGGVGQFHFNTFSRGMASIGIRRVRVVRKRVRAKAIRIVDHYSNGVTRRRYGWPVRQEVVHTYQGVIPRYADRLHAWAQVRIMARAIAGLGSVRDSEWEVRC